MSSSHQFAGPVRQFSLRGLVGVMLLLIGSVLAASSVTASASGSLSVTTSAAQSPSIGVQSNAVLFDVGSVASVGVVHTCATDTSGALFCWGDNTAGQLGDGTTTSASKPVAVASGEMPSTAVSAVAAGEVQTCAVHTGQVYCWGQNASLQLGFIGTQQLTPKKVPNVANGFQNSGVTALSASFGATCAIASNRLFCWGEDGQITGRLANQHGSDVPTAIPAGGGFSNTAVSAAAMGQYSACAIESSKAYCWGYNIGGVLGAGIASTVKETVPVSVSASGGFTNSGVTSISVGAENACAVENGAVFCWGDGSQGVLGVGAASSNVPVAQPSPLNSGVTSVQLGDGYACALKAGLVYCWGNDINGTLGRGDSPPTVRSVAVVSDSTGGNGFVNSNVSAVSIGGSRHSCVISRINGTNRMSCWGSGAAGRLGDGSTQIAYRPVTVCTTCAAPAQQPGGGGALPGTRITTVTVSATLTNTGLAFIVDGLPNAGFSDGSLKVMPLGANPTQYTFWGLMGLQVTNGRLTHTSRCLIKPGAQGQPPITEAFDASSNYTISSFLISGGSATRDPNYPNGWHVIGGPLNVTIDSGFTSVAGDCLGGGSPGGGTPGGGAPVFVPAPVSNDTTPPTSAPEGVGESDLISEERQEQLTSSAGEGKVLVNGELVDASVTQASADLRSSDPAQRSPQQVTELQSLAASMLEQLNSALGGGTGSVSVRNTPTGAVILGLATDPVTGQPLEIPVENVVFVSGGGLVLMASGIDGRSPARIGLDGSVEIPEGGYVSVVAGGLTPGEGGEVVVMSTPRLIGSFDVGESGDVREQAALPTDLGSGSHTLVVTVGDEAASLGFRVVPNGVRPTLPVTGGGDDLIVVWSLAFLVAGALVLALDRRRHLFTR